MPADTPLRAEDVDLGSMAFWSLSAEERERSFAVLRRDAPISRHPEPEDIFGREERDESGYWAVVRHEDIRAISRDPRTFSSAQGVQFADAPPEMLEASQSLLAMDAPRHTKLRGLVNKAFSPRQVARIEDGIRANARRVVDEAAPRGGGDFVELIAKRLPLITFSEMLGVPDADREEVVEAADLLVTAADPEVQAGRDPLELLAMALGTLHRHATGLAARREHEPSDDLMSALVHAEVDGERLTHPEIAAFFVLISVAANDTSRHTTSHAMRALSLHPEQRDQLVGGLEGRLPVAVEEFVRWATPVMTFRRTTTRAVELHGQRINAGEKVVLFYASGNRDAEAFERPGDFDVTREPNRHLGFGGGGPHFCLGASLARTQLRALFTELLTRLPDLEVDEPEIFPSSFIHGVKRMECSFTAREAASAQP